MKALSVKQPWAWLLAHGFKDIENRSWPTTFRGRFYIHAGKSWGAEQEDDVEWVKDLAGEAGLVIPLPDRFDLGGIVGEATVSDCVSNSESVWFNGPFGFVIADAQPVALLPCRGILGFFTPAALRA